MANASRSLLLFFVSLTLQSALAELELRTHERRAPWGTLQKRYSYYLKDGKEIKHGIEKTFYCDGKLLSEAHYQHGKLHGLLTAFYEGIEKKSSEENFRNGKRHGMSHHWSPQGELLYECEYRDGQAWEGRDSPGGTASHGFITRKRADKTFAYSKGKKVRASQRTIEVSYQHKSPEDLPDMKAFVRWNWISYRIDSDYPFLDVLPPREKVPFLIDWCAKQGDSSNVAHSQLVALTRVDFGEMRDPDKKKRKAEISAWREWWNASGKTRSQLDKKKGVRDEDAWKLVARGRKMAMPEAPIGLPETYTIELRFSSGDYGGRVEEQITLMRGAEGAILERVFSTRTGGPEKKERWSPFTPEDADRTARAIAYLIDQPWLLNDEKALHQYFWEQMKKSDGKTMPMGAAASKQMAGRESFGLYYPNASYSMTDGEGKVWWNDDPWSWDGENESCFNQAAQPVLSSVYPFFVSLYPESKRGSGADQPGWVEAE